MSLAVAEEIGKAILAKNVTAAEATLGTLGLEGIRYGGDAVRKSYNKLRRRSFARGPSTKFGKLGKRMRERLTSIKSKRQKKQHPIDEIFSKRVNSNMETEGEAAKFGEQPGIGIIKKRGSGYGPSANATNVLYDIQVGYPTKGSEINERPNDIIFVKGLRYCANFKSLLEGDLDSMFCNFAIVSRKDNVNSGSQMDVGMFTSRDSNREQNFEETPEAIDRHCLPLSLDKYHVWTHKRFKLRGKGTNMPGSKMLSGYIPLNRQIRFTGANQPNAELSVMWWFGRENTVSTAPFTSGQPAGNQAYETSALSTNIALTLYWDDPVSLYMLKSAMSSVKRRPKYKRRSKSRGPRRGYQ